MDARGVMLIQRRVHRGRSNVSLATNHQADEKGLHEFNRKRGIGILCRVRGVLWTEIWREIRDSKRGIGEMWRGILPSSPH